LIEDGDDAASVVEDLEVVVVTATLQRKDASSVCIISDGRC